MNFINDYINKCSLYIGKDWIWYRIHKTAGTSLKDALHRHCINIVDNSKEFESWQSTINEDQFKNYFKWTFVRNPYDRFNSTAAMFHLKPLALSANFHSIRKDNRVIKRHSEQQHRFTHFEGKPMYDQLYRFENLREDFRKLCSKLGLQYKELKMLNKSVHNNWKDQLKPDTIDFINKYYEKDFEYFNYQMI